MKDGESKPHGSRSFVALKGLSPIELLPNVVSHLPVKAGLAVGQLVRDRVGAPFREQRCGIELEQPLLHHPAHKVRDIGRMHAITEAALEAVAVQQGHEQLEVLFLAIVRSRGRARWD